MDKGSFNENDKRAPTSDRRDCDTVVTVEDDDDVIVCPSDIDTFLKIQDTLASLKTNFETELNEGGVGASKRDAHINDIIANLLIDNAADVNAESKNSVSNSGNRVSSGHPFAGNFNVEFTTHSSVIYNGDRMDISKQKTTVRMKKSDHEMFIRIVNTFAKLLMGTYTLADLKTLRRDHDSLITLWDGIKDDVFSGAPVKNETGMRRDINDLMRTMLETPLYYTTSCTSLIACGRMLRNLYVDTYGKSAEAINDILDFVRKEIRHVNVNPFACECTETERCSVENKLLLSMILELPSVVQNQTYLLQILAYLMYNTNGREEIFVINMKNIISPGLIDRLPVRTAMLLGTLDRVKIKRHINDLKSHISKYTSLGSISRLNSAYNGITLNKIVNTVTDPRVKPFINKLNGAQLANFTVEFPPCENVKLCKSKDCCGPITVTAEELFTSSISLSQLFVYMCTNTNKASQKSQQHYYVRDIILCMANNTIGIDEEAMEDAFGYIDRTDMFTGFENNPLMTMSLKKLIASYMECMDKAANKYKNMSSNDRRKMTRKLNVHKHSN